MDSRLRAAKLLVYLGFGGFFICWGIGWLTEIRVFSSAIFLEQTSQRPEQVVVKGATYFLEPIYARAFKASQVAILVSFLVMVLGGACVQRRKWKDKGK